MASQITDASSGMILAALVDGNVAARRSDGLPLTETDWTHVYRCFQNLPSPPTVPVPIPVAATQADGTKGRIMAMEICSDVLQAHTWLAFDHFDPKDGQAVFYAHEIPLVKNKSAQQLCEIHKVKLVFGSGSRVRK